MRNSVATTFVLYLLKLYFVQTLIIGSIGLVFKFVVLCCSGGYQLSHPVSTVAYSGCWMKMTSRSRVEKMAINAFSHSRLWPSWRRGPVKKMKLPRQLPWGVKSSTPPGGNALIYAVDMAMSAECILHVIVGQPKHQLQIRPNL